MIKQANIDSFLKLGYFLNYSNPSYSFDFSGIDKSKYKGNSLNELVEIGSKFFMNSVDKQFKKNETHVVPLSGGLDSRAVLGALLEFTPASNIYTYTFGTPGTLDFELGNNIARIIGTQHVNLPLTEYEYNMDELMDISKRIDHQTVLFHHPPIGIVSQLFKNHQVWSGFFGDPLVGSHFIPNSPKDINEAKTLFLEKNNYQKSINLSHRDDHSYDKFIEITTDKNVQVSTFELLDFENRQLKFIAPHVLMKGFEYQTPFLDQKLFDFFLSIDNDYREGQLLYKKMLLKLFPELFSYPVKNNIGLPLNASKISVFSKKVSNKVNRIIRRKHNENINYLDFDLKIREKSDLTEIVRSNMHDLYNRGAINWIDVREVYKNHINLKGNYGKSLVLLTSLEIHFKSMENK